jgi:hypothetical protein
LKFPKAGSLLTNDVRRCRTNKFPYGIVYMLEDNEHTIIIVAVMHLHREPGYWKDRL